MQRGTYRTPRDSGNRDLQTILNEIAALEEKSKAATGRVEMLKAKLEEVGDSLVEAGYDIDSIHTELQNRVKELTERLQNHLKEVEE